MSSLAVSKTPTFSQWNLHASASSTHAKTFYFLLQDSTFILIQLVYSTMNSWSHSVQATMRVYRKDGTKKSKTVGLGASDFHLSNDNLTVDTGVLKIECLDPTNGTKFHITYNDPESGLKLDATVTSVCDAVQVGDGIVKFTEKLDEGSTKSKFIPKAFGSGSYTIDKKTVEFQNAYSCGINALTHLPQNVLQWNLVALHNQTDALMLYKCDLPHNKIECHALLVLNSTLHHVLLSSPKTTFVGAEVDDFSGHYVPKSIIHELSGSCLVSGKQVLLKITVPLSRLLDKIDVLGELPYLVRVFIQTFITAPYCYQWMDDNVVLSLDVGGEKKEISGVVFNETSFLAGAGETSF